MIIEAPEALRTWLTREMAPICDAEPAALAKYVLALLRKDKPESELMEFCIEQLDVFLQTKARPFVEKLFRIIRERSYIITTAATSATIPMLQSKNSFVMCEKKKDTDERKEVKEKRESVKRKCVSQGDKEKEQQKVRDDKESEKTSASETVSGPPQKARKRISPPVDIPQREECRRDHSANRFERRRSRSPRERRLERGDRNLDRRVAPLPTRLQHWQPDRYKTDRPERLERKRSRSPRSPYERQRREKSGEPEIRKKKRCRDYDEKGYCMKGDQCIYDHGPDPVVVDDIALEKMVTNGAKPAVTQIATNFSVPPPGYTPLNPPPPGVDNVYATNSSAVVSAALSEGYNPEAPALSASSIPIVAAAHSLDFSVPPPPIPPVVVNQPWRPTTYTVPAMSSSVLIHPAANAYDPAHSSTTVPSHNVTQLTTSQRRRGRGGGTGNVGRYGQSVGAVNRTLQVRKIPAELNNIAKLNEHFGQFGQIVNMQVCFESDPEAALITYANRYEAVAAYKSTVPILNNRFIKVFWHSTNGQANNVVNASQVAPTNSSSVTFNARGSLTKTVHVGSRLAGSAVKNSQTVHPANSQSIEPQASRSAINQSLIDREKYIEVRRRRKQEKENRMRLIDLQRRKSNLMSKEIEQQKIILEKMKAGEITPEKKKKLYKIFKRLESSVAKTKGEIAELNEMLVKTKTVSEATKTTDNSNGCGGAAESVTGVDLADSDAGELSVSDMVPSPKKIRLQDSSQILDNRSKMVVVRGFEAGTENEVIIHMEHFGELVDMDFGVPAQDKSLTAYFTYKKRRDAEQAVSLGADYPAGHLIVEWAPKHGAEASGVVPDEKRQPSERVTPAALLASCPLDESDDDGNED
ncbi:cutaneous T-cell lymphoma tumor antigen se70-2 [Loa loa]|uniref:Cutaneous T-cell lymphoma tumor antigen se70-2 n=1 Tax=Loa loa TaxID=7209 RepID=A0A1I7VK33_LOALO|nr:cutaneous T-cell lymphoma tumor antigen se70-2 [Loa loa]EFO25866.1 cutaneous T-cell lymphoma tumor antigen se70-2 [Loa loa]